MNSSSISQHSPIEGEAVNLDEVYEEDYERYKSNDANDNGPMLNEDDDYILLGLQRISFFLFFFLFFGHRNHYLPF